jgi:lysophospholipase L1-like esterase
MKLLIVADSHGRGMATVIHGLNKEWIVMTVFVGGQTEAVRDRYLDRLTEIRQFDPSRIILHVGHNDLNFHPRYNQDPQFVKELFPVVLGFIHLLQANHPAARIHYSSIFPRTIGPHMNEVSRKSYNKLASRYGCLTQSTCRKEGHRFMLNGALWISVRQARENSDYFLEDGLHLSADGQKVVARDWIKELTVV